ncbi:MAG TPA: OsmC family protein [Xanthobacteraceae bacterium]|nr:OsmC family protein [Xanthobacteraceae bacterium]
MSEFDATIEWTRPDGAAFVDGRYSRAHVWRFDGGAEVAASSSPHSVPLPLSVAENVDPEEALVAALSSCHMLFFLSLAAKRGFVVDRYQDAARGTMTRNARGRMAMTRVILNPRVEYAGSRPDRATEEELHHQAHDLCYIANSVTAEVETHLGDSEQGR